MANQGNLKTASVNGADLHYIERGSGEPVIFVHGSQGDYRTWLPILDAYAQNYRAIAYSRRYHYPNAWAGSGTDYTVSLHANDLIAFIEGLHTGPVRVVGNSFGAYTTLIAAARRPDLLRKIVIGEPPILPWLLEIPGGQAYYDYFMKNAWLPAKEAFQNGDLEQGLRLFVNGVSGPGEYDRLPDPVRARFLENAPSLKAETLSPDYFTELTVPQVQNIQVPALLLKGENSPKMFHLVVDRLAQELPNNRITTIPNASHAMYAGNPQAYNQAVLDFLKA